MPKTVYTLVRAVTKRPYWWVYAGGTVLLVVSMLLWWTKVYLHPSNVFWGMIDTSLSTQSVTVHTKRADAQNSIDQYVQFELGSVDKAHSLTTIKQGGTTVRTELIGTPDRTYSRYLDIKTDQKNASGNALDVSKIEGLWAASPANGAQGNTNEHLFSQAVLATGLPLGSLAVPIGDLSSEDRAKLIAFTKEQAVYDASFKDVAKARKDGRTHYTYTAKIQTILYVRMLKIFAEGVGLDNLKDIDPNSFSGSAPLEVQLTVDAVSRHLVGVSIAGTEYMQTYSGYGVPVQAAIPSKSITNEELQRRLSGL